MLTRCKIYSKFENVTIAKKSVFRFFQLLYLDEYRRLSIPEKTVRKPVKNTIDPIKWIRSTDESITSKNRSFVHASVCPAIIIFFKNASTSEINTSTNIDG